MSFITEKEKHDKRFNEELEKAGIFWAFGSQQFEEYRTYKEESLDYKNYLSIGHGGYIHKKDREKLDKFFLEVVPQLNKEFAESVDRETHILYELDNHECFYTCDITDVFEGLKHYYNDITEEEIKKVFNKNKKHYN